MLCHAYPPNYPGDDRINVLTLDSRSCQDATPPHEQLWNRDDYGQHTIFSPCVKTGRKKLPWGTSKKLPRAPQIRMCSHLERERVCNSGPQDSDSAHILMDKELAILNSRVLIESFGRFHSDSCTAFLLDSWNNQGFSTLAQYGKYAIPSIALTRARQTRYT